MEIICGNCGHSIGLTPDEQKEYDGLIRIAEVRGHTNEEYERFVFLNKKKHSLKIIE